jgi:two-component system sensor histidine kinase BarA
VAVVVTVKSKQKDLVTIHIEVRDTGIGLSKDDQERIFCAFSQTDPDNNRRYSGTGLGLVISKRLVQLMDSEINVTSSMGSGANFSFDFNSETITSLGRDFSYNRLSHLTAIVYETYPLANQALLQMLKFWQVSVISVTSYDELRQELQQNPSKAQLMLLGGNYLDPTSSFIEQFLTPIRKIFTGKIVVLTEAISQKNIKQLLHHGVDLCMKKPLRHKKCYHDLCNLLLSNNYVATTVEPPINIRGTKVLIIDDDSLNRQILTTYLTELRCNVTAASCGKNGIDKSIEDQFDLIMLDMNMPDIDGITTAQTIRQKSKLNKNTPIILISSDFLDSATYKDNQKIINAQLLKPLSKNQLESLLLKWCYSKVTTHT